MKKEHIYAAIMSVTSPDSQINDPIFDKYAEDSEERSSGDTNDTPNSEISPPDSPITKTADLNQAHDQRANARRLAASLSLEEQVRLSRGHFESS